MLKKIIITIAFFYTIILAENAGNITSLSVYTSPVDNKMYFYIRHTLGVASVGAWNLCYIEIDPNNEPKNAYTLSLLQKALQDQTLKLNLIAKTPWQVHVQDTNSYHAVITEWAITR